eukprot:2997558-Amphidinium_carterae.5
MVTLKLRCNELHVSDSVQTPQQPHNQRPATRGLPGQTGQKPTRKTPKTPPQSPAGSKPIGVLSLCQR